MKLPRFMLRDLFWLVLVVACCCGWYLEHRGHLEYVHGESQEAVRIQQAEINSAVERWYFEKGTWPADDLSDIGSDPNYFPEGLPVNPASGDPYSLHPTSHRVR